MNVSLLKELQNGIPLVSAPFGAIGQRIGWSEGRVLEEINSWLSAGLIKRCGLIIRHRLLGYDANAMAVWDIPDELVEELAAEVIKHSFVTLCYRRQRCLPEWPYNLYCMVHGQERRVVEHQIQELNDNAGLGVFPREVLFSTRMLKQRGARYIHGGN